MSFNENVQLDTSQVESGGRSSGGGFGRSGGSFPGGIQVGGGIGGLILLILMMIFGGGEIGGVGEENNKQSVSSTGVRHDWSPDPGLRSSPTNRLGLMNPAALSRKGRPANHHRHWLLPQVPQLPLTLPARPPVSVGRGKRVAETISA